MPSPYRGVREFQANCTYNAYLAQLEGHPKQIENCSWVDEEFTCLVGGAIPGVDTIIDVGELVSGRDCATGQPLAIWEYIVTLLCVVIPVSGYTVRHALKGGKGGRALMRGAADDLITPQLMADAERWLVERGSIRLPESPDKIPPRQQPNGSTCYLTCANMADDILKKTNDLSDLYLEAAQSGIDINHLTPLLRKKGYDVEYHGDLTMEAALSKMNIALQNGEVPIVRSKLMGQAHAILVIEARAEPFKVIYKDPFTASTRQVSNLDDWMDLIPERTNADFIVVK
jgi:hypothetical protein